MKIEVPDLIEIIKLPHGEAPLHIRAKWIGCVFPTDRSTSGDAPLDVQGVQSRAYKGTVAGFVVDQGTALQILAEHSVKAAEWFEARGYPRQDESFVFRTEDIQVVSYGPPAAQKIQVWDDLEQAWKP